jgi:hypothetical protein
VDAIGELEQALGTRPDVKDGQNLLHKFDVLSFAVEELLELIKDPEAGRESSISPFYQCLLRSFSL